MAAILNWADLARAYPELACIPPGLRAAGLRRDLKNGETLFRIGDLPRWMFFVLSGEIRLLRRSLGGGEVILQRCGRGFFAEASLDSKAYPCDALSDGPSDILCFPLRGFRQALAIPEFRDTWIAHLSREVRKLRAQTERLSLNGAGVRVLHYIESEGTDGAILLSRSRKAWAAELGLTHEALYRTLSRLQAEGLLLIEGERISVAAKRRSRR